MLCGGYAERLGCIAWWLTDDPEDREPYEEVMARYPVIPEPDTTWSKPRPGARPRR
jgi:hypothetical protein